MRKLEREVSAYRMLASLLKLFKVLLFRDASLLAH
jgi:hypothetical protein